jgi:nitrite reductase/ring-hydroxylating ferredoxin subunit
MEYVEVALADLRPGAVVPVPVLYKTQNITALVVRADDKVVVYLDLCPHNKIVLSETGNYVNESGDRLRCEAHGATFDLLDGSCDRGPCKGETLARIPFELIDGAVRIQKQLAPH